VKARILVVDDEPDVTYTLKATLEATGLFAIYPSITMDCIVEF
jgi:CheY-like chemotaxis protein